MNSDAWATPAQQQRCPNGQTACNAGQASGSTDVVIPPANPPATGGASVEVRSGTSATLTMPGGNGVIVIPANAMISSGTVQMSPVAADAVPAANPGTTIIGQAIEITLFDKDGNPIARPTFANPVRITLALISGDGLNANSTVAFYDESTKQWTAIPSTIDLSTGTITGEVSHFTTFAVVEGLSAGDIAALATTPSALPKTGEAEKGQPSIWGWAIVALLLVAGAALTFRARQAKVR
jgi:hypothetical protein